MQVVGCSGILLNFLVSIYFLQAAESNSHKLSFLNLCIGLLSAFRLAAYFSEPSKCFWLFFQQMYFLRSVKSSVGPNTIREFLKIRVILLTLARSSLDSSLFLVACLYWSIRLMTWEGVWWCFPITKASQNSCRVSDFSYNVAFCTSIPRLIPASFLTSCIFNVQDADVIPSKKDNFGMDYWRKTKLDRSHCKVLSNWC